MQDHLVWTEVDQTSPGYEPCRYRVPFDSRRGLPDTLALTLLPYISLSSPCFLLFPSLFQSSLDAVACTNLPTFQAAIARVSALLVAKKEKKAAPPKKTRGKKAKTA